MPDIQGGAAQPVAESSQAPSAGPAIPIAVVYDGRAVMAGPVQPIVEVTDGRMRMGGAAIPVVVGNAGNGFTIAGPPMPVYVVSGVLQDALLLESGDFLLQEDDSYILLEA